MFCEPAGSGMIFPGRKSAIEGGGVPTLARCVDSRRAIKRSEAGWMRSRNGVGKMPITTTIATSGVSTAHSRPERSERAWFSLCLMGPKKTRWYIHSM